MLEEEIEKLVKKGTMTPEELLTVEKAIKTIKCIDEMLGKGLYSEGHNYRSPVTGRYIDAPSHGHATTRMYYGDDNYSGHSIADRMVARLEPMFDQAQTEYERNKVSEAISQIRHMN